MDKKTILQLVIVGGIFAVLLTDVIVTGCLNSKIIDARRDFVNNVTKDGNIPDNLEVES